MRFTPPRNSYKTITTTGNQFTTVQIIKAMAFEAQQDKLISQIVKKYNITPDLQGIEKLFNLIFFNTFFMPDPENRQIVRSPRSLIFGKYGNCVDYCACILAFCIYLKIPCSLIIAATDKDNPDKINHIYCEVFNKYIIDLVIGQDQNGLEAFKFIQDRKNFFGHEAPSVFKLKFPVPIKTNIYEN